MTTFQSTILASVISGLIVVGIVSMLKRPSNPPYDPRFMA